MFSLKDKHSDKKLVQKDAEGKIALRALASKSKGTVRRSAPKKKITSKGKKGKK